MPSFCISIVCLLLTNEVHLYRGANRFLASEETFELSRMANDHSKVSYGNVFLLNIRQKDAVVAIVHFQKISILPPQKFFL